MYFVARNVQRQDLDACFLFAQARYGYADSERAAVTGLWKALLESKMALMHVVEDQDQSRGQRLVLFGCVSAVNQAFLGAIKEGPQFHVDLAALDWWSVGRSLQPSPGEYEREHVALGLTFVNLFVAMDMLRYGPVERMEAFEIGSSFFQGAIARKRIWEYVEQSYGEQERERLTLLGLSEARVYPEAAERPKGQKGAPCLFAGVNEDVRKEPRLRQTVAGRFAWTKAPRFNFSPFDHEVLGLALDGRTDQEIAAELKISLAAIKKRWQGVFIRVETVDSQFFDLGESQSPGALQRNRRRQLMRVLRQHPEEFWPAALPLSKSYF
jgi:hypothetical protein